MADERAPLLPHDEELDQSLSGRLSAAMNSPATLNSLERFLALAAIGLLLVSLLTLGLLTGLATVHNDERSKPRSTVTKTRTQTRTHTVLGPTTTAFPKPRKNKDLCVTAACVSTAARIIAALDETVDPCEDFYGFANNGWLRANPIPPAKAIYGIGEQVDEQNKRLIQSIIAEAPSPTLPAADQRNLNTLRTFYGSCMADDTLEKEGDKPLVEMVSHLVDSWRGKGKTSFHVQTGGGRWDPDTRRDRLTSALLYLHSRGVPALLDFYLEGDVKVAPKKLVLWMQQSGLSFSKDYYSDESALEKLETVIENTLRSLYTNGLNERADASRLAKSVVLFETKLANASISEIDMADPEGTYNKFNATALATLFPSISLGDYFAGYSPRSYPDPVIVTSPAYIEEVVEILANEEDDVIESYFVFRMAQSLGLLLTPKSEVYQQVQGLQNYLTGLSDTKPIRSQVCLQSLLDSFGFLVGRYYVEETFSAESKDYAEDVIVAIIKSFKTKLPSISFLDDESRAGALEKADAITHKIGYPSYPNTTDADAMERYYAISPTTDSYFGNVVTSRVADLKREWSQVNQERNPATWEMIPSEVNAYYNPPTNEVVFPAGILTSNYFSVNWPEYLAFGAFGSVAGHEISHAFDSSGRQYDSNGKLSNWWTNSTVERFERLADCFVKQYAKYFIVGPDGKKHFVQSRLTLGEDGSDSGGLSQAFGAWKERYNGDRKMKHYRNFELPGLAHYSREQLFFIAFAQSWPRQATPEEAVRRIRVDPHSPTQFRVQGALSNSEEFATAFGCKAGSPMSNVDKCKIW